MYAPIKKKMIKNPACILAHRRIRERRRRKFFLVSFSMSIKEMTEKRKVKRYGRMAGGEPKREAKRRRMIINGELPSFRCLLAEIIKAEDIRKTLRIINKRTPPKE